MGVIIKLNNVNKNYKMQDHTIVALNDINLTFETGKIYGIMGHSGSGKSTLLSVLGLLLESDQGSIIFKDQLVSELSEEDKAKIRNREIGFVFQSYLLNSNLRAYENVMVPMYINKEIPHQRRKELAIQLLEKVDLQDRSQHFPRQLSGGEQQRVALARALANNPSFILADEPTGNLDVESEYKIMEIFKHLKEEDKCIVIVSHNDIIKKYADVLYEMKEGSIKEVTHENL